MKIFALTALATLVASSAMADDLSLAYRGNGNRAGGYAYLLNRGGEISGVARQARDPKSEILLAYRGTGNRAGGYAYFLNKGGQSGGAVQRPRTKARSPARLPRERQSCRGTGLPSQSRYKALLNRSTKL
jgi:hypothetical protein